VGDRTRLSEIDTIRGAKPVLYRCDTFIVIFIAQHILLITTYHPLYRLSVLEAGS